MRAVGRRPNLTVTWSLVLPQPPIASALARVQQQQQHMAGTGAKRRVCGGSVAARMRTLLLAQRELLLDRRRVDLARHVEGCVEQAVEPVRKSSEQLTAQVARVIEPVVVCTRTR